MSVTKTHSRVIGVAGSLLLGLTACSGSLFQSKAAPPTIYMLSASGQSVAAAARVPGLPPADHQAAGESVAAIPVDLAVLKPRVRIGLESDRIAILYPDRHLDYFAGARWSGALADIVQDLVVQAFRSRASLRTVSADTSVFASTYWMEIEVTDFQAEYTTASAAPTVNVHFTARLGNSTDRRLLGRFEATAQRIAAENRLTAIVDAYAVATQAALKTLVQDSEQTLRTSSEAR
jgi:cholesterol transport system auxiliary component